MKSHFSSRTVLSGVPACWGILVLLLLVLSVTAASAAETERTGEPHTTKTDTMIVIGFREALGQYQRSVSDGDRIKNILLDTPFHLIRRGTGSISDLYSDGLKRNDINVTVDGERFTTACPNRMDTRIGQIDMLDIERINMSRNSAVLQSGLGGQVDFRRRLPSQEKRIYGQIMGNSSHSETFDGSLAVEGDRMRLSSRYRSYSPYTDARDRTFTDMYNYTGEFNTTIYEIRGHLAFDGGDAVATYENSKDILFPYLLMDERTNDHYQVSTSYRDHRFYFNHTRHVMDNYLRGSYAMTDMVTDAKNTMFGVVGDFYEVYARNWDADNHITPLANPAMGKVNHMLPDVWRLGATLQHDIGDPDNPWLFVRAGMIRTKVDDPAVLDMFQTLHADAELTSWSFPLGLTATHTMELSENYLFGFSAEVSSDAPGVEQQFIATDKPGVKPDWIGNPELADPLRTTLRAALNQKLLRFEVFTTRIWNYPYLVRQALDGAMYQTYDGVDAMLAGANVSASWRWFDAGVFWNWGEKTEDSSPLAEIQPITLHLAVTSPRFGRYYGHALYQHASGQGRVDQGLDETITGAWNRLDLGVVREHDRFRLALDVHNLTNVLYTQHLSYLRSPFASGIRIYEPGRTVRATVSYLF